MRACTIKARNFRPFVELKELRLGPMTTIVGKNDSGKSSILKALDLFLNGSALSGNDVNANAPPDDHVLIEVSFDSLPESIELEDGVSGMCQ